MKYKYKVIRCSKDDCGRFFRTVEDAIDHENCDYHCERCGWGTYDPTGVSKKFKLCEACHFIEEYGVSSKQRANQS